MLSIEPVDRLSSTNTSSPRSSSASARWEPTKPAPPVINTRNSGPLETEGGVHAGPAEPAADPDQGAVRTAATTRSIAAASSAGYSGNDSTRSQTRSAIGHESGR